MKYYVFPTLTAADDANDAITQNVRQWVEAHVPDAIDGDFLRGRRASDGAFVGVLTKRWAEPTQTTNGTWVFAKPTADKTAPIPLDVFIAGVQAVESDFDPAWFPFTGIFG